MDRVRCFNMLGLSENATKAQVKRAYARKLAMYKGPNYAEEPAYAERKMAQLRQAYEEAYALAESNTAAYPTSRIERETEPVSKKKPAKSSRLLDAELDEEGSSNREKFHQWMERRDDEKHKRKDSKRKELPKLQKPDLTKLKNKLNEIKDEVASQLDFSEEGDSFEPELLAKESEAAEDGFAEFVKDSVYTEEKPQQGRTVSRSKSSFDDDASDRENSSPSTTKDSKGISMELVKLIVSIIVLVVAAIGGCTDDSVDYEDYEEETAALYIYDIDSEDIAEKDLEVADLAEQSYMLLLDQTRHNMATIESDDRMAYLEKAATFAKNYWGKETVAEVVEELSLTYPDYIFDVDASLDDKLDTIFAFYGFAELGEAEWYDQPYTGGRIESYGDYLDYLNQFYEEQ